MEWNFEIPQHGLHLRLLFYQLVKLDGMRLKIEGILISYIFVVLIKTCFETISPKVRHLVHDLLPIKTLVRHISQTFIDVLKKN